MVSGPPHCRYAAQESGGLGSGEQGICGGRVTTNMCHYVATQPRYAYFFQAATDLLVRQKNFSVGQPNHEIHIER